MNKPVNRFVDYLLPESMETRLHAMRQKYPNIDAFHEQGAPGTVRDPEDIIKFWVDKDPTFQKKYAPTVLRWYDTSSKVAKHLASAGQGAHEVDHEFLFQHHGDRVHQALTDFHNISKKMPPGQPRDIASYENLPALEKAVSPYLDQETRKQRMIKDKSTIEQGSDVVHHSDKLSVRKINTFPAMEILGRQTKWCTTMKPDIFNSYTRKGPLYFIHDKEGSQRYLYHPNSAASEALVDEADRRNSGQELLQRHPVLSELFPATPHFATTAAANWESTRLFVDRLTELFDDPAPLRTLPPFKKSFKVGDNDYEMQVTPTIYNKPNKWDVAFGQITYDQWGRKLDDTLTGTGHAPKVIGTVFHGLKDLIMRHTPDKVSFGSHTGTEPSRTKLYRHMTKKFSKLIGYDWSEEPTVHKDISSVIFHLTKPGYVEPPPPPPPAPEPTRRTPGTLGRALRRFWRSPEPAQQPHQADRWALELPRTRTGGRLNWRDFIDEE